MSGRLWQWRDVLRVLLAVDRVECGWSGVDLLLCAIIMYERYQRWLQQCGDNPLPTADEKNIRRFGMDTNQLLQALQQSYELFAALTQDQDLRATEISMGEEIRMARVDVENMIKLEIQNLQQDLAGRLVNIEADQAVIDGNLNTRLDGMSARQAEILSVVNRILTALD